jgi:hypothetical protein
MHANARSSNLCTHCRYHQYKFIVDGKWMHDETAPYMPDPLGNVNNWLFVRKIDPPAAAAAAAAAAGAAPNG